MAVLFLISPFQSSEAADARNNPRIRNFTIMMAVPFSIFFKDFAKIPLDFNVTTLLFGYYSSFTGIIVVGFVGVSALIYFNDKAEIARNPQDHLGERPYHRVVLFAMYGGARLWRVIEEERRHFASFNPSAGQVNRMANATAAFAVLLMGVLGSLALGAGRRRDEARNMLDDQILIAVEAAVKLHARQSDRLSVRANYMLAVPTHAAAAELHRAVAYPWPPEPVRTHLLVLHRYTNRSPDRQFVMAATHKEPRLPALPGAQEAFESGLYSYVDKQKLRGVPKLPRAAQTLMKRVLDAVTAMRCFVSIPIVTPSGTVGILNLESSEEFILGEGRPAMEALIKCLYPYCMLLGQVLGAEAGTSRGAD